VGDLDTERRLKRLEDMLGRLRTADAAVLGVGARIYNSGNISINNNAETALTFDSERYDPSGMHSTASNTSRLTCTHAGKHLITTHVRFAANATGIRYIFIRLNGTTTLATDLTAPISGVVTVLSVATIYDLAATDYVEVVAYQNSGGNLNVVASGNDSPEFVIHRLP
jgi:hypothetical protein